MSKLVVAVIGLAGALLAADRFLLWMEKRGWLYYRRKKPNWSASVYHLREMHSVFDPGIEQVQEVIVEDEQQEDESGGPPAPDGDAHGLPGRPFGSPDIE